MSELSSAHWTHSPQTPPPPPLDRGARSSGLGEQGAKVTNCVCGVFDVCVVGVCVCVKFIRREKRLASWTTRRLL